MTSSEARRTVLSPSGEERRLRLREEFDLSDEPISSPVESGASTPSANFKAPEAQRAAALKVLRIGDPSVGHMYLSAALPRACCRGALTTAEGLIEGPPFTTEAEVIHRPLTCGTELERPEEEIRDPLTRLYIPTNHCRVMWCIKE